MFAKVSRTYYTGMIGTEKSELAELVFLETYGSWILSDSSNSVYSYEYHPKYEYPEAKDFVRMQEYYEAGSGCGSVGRADASDTRGLRFESSHW